MPAVEAHAHEPDLPVPPGRKLRLEQLVVDRVRRAPAVQEPDVQAIGLQLPQAGFQVRQGRLPVLSLCLAADVNLVAILLEGRPHHAFVIAALVDARRIEVVDAHVGRALHHALVRTGIAAEGQARDLQARLPQGSIGKLGRGLRCGSKCRKRQAGSQEGAARRRVH